MVHAGLAPQWDLTLDASVRPRIRGSPAARSARLFGRLYGDQPDLWEEAREGEERLRFIANCFTRLRYVDADGRLALRAKGSPKKSQTKSLIPWFEAPGARWRGPRIVFGHWSTLGFFRNPDVVGLDTGCVWGGALTALRLDDADASPVQIPCAAGPA